MLGTMVGNKIVYQTQRIRIVVWLIVILVFGWLTSLCVGWAISPPGPININNFAGGINRFILICVLGATMCGSLCVFFGCMAAPFYLSVDLTNRTYELARGIRPCIIRWSGSLNEIQELRVKHVSTQNAGEVFVMQLIWAKQGRAALMLDSTKDDNKAYHLIQEAADILGVPPSAQAV